MKHIETSVAKRMEFAAKAQKDVALEAEKLLAELGMQKVTKSMNRGTKVTYRVYKGYVRGLGGKVPSVEKALSKRGIKVVYEHDMILADLPSGIIIRTYPPYRDTVTVVVSVPMTEANVEAYHKDTVKLLSLDKLRDKDHVYYALRRKKMAKGMRLVSGYFASVSDDGKKDPKYTAVLKALKANKYVPDPVKVLDPTKGQKKTKVVYRKGNNSVIVLVTETTYTHLKKGHSVSAKIYLVTPSATKDISE